MAKSFRTVESMGNIINSRMNLVKTWDKKDALAILLPQRVEENMLYNFRGQVIGGCDGEDVVFHEDDSILTNTTRITDKFLNTFYEPMANYFGVAAEVEVEKPETEWVEKTKKEDVEPESNDEVTEDGYNLIADIEKFIGKDKLKKAKKLLAAHEDNADYKAAKKLIKKAKGE